METMSFLQVLDSGLNDFSDRLVVEVGLERAVCSRVASTIHAEVVAQRDRLGMLAADLTVPAKRRLQVLEDLQIWRRFRHEAPGAFGPEREQQAEFIARVVLDSYLAFVYLNDELFGALGRIEGGVARQCSAFILDPAKPLKPLREAFARGRWDPTASGLLYWDQPEGEPHARQYEASPNDILFYLALCRTAAWPVLLMLAGEDGAAHTPMKATKDR